MELQFHVHQERELRPGKSATISRRDLEHEYSSLPMALDLWCNTKGLVYTAEPVPEGDGLIVTLSGDVSEAIARRRLAHTLKRLNDQRYGLHLVADALV